MQRIQLVRDSGEDLGLPGTFGKRKAALILLKLIMVKMREATFHTTLKVKSSLAF